MFSEFIKKVYEIKQKLWLFPYSIRSKMAISDYIKRNPGSVCVNIGSGPSLIDGWLNGDSWPYKGTVYVDATKPLPFEDGTVKFINCEHMIEHIGYDEGSRFLNECYRVLQDKGVLRISTPSLKKFIQAYLGNTNLKEAELLMHARRYYNLKAENMCGWFNDNMYMWGHKFIFDEDTLIELLKKAGFSDIRHQEYGKSSHIQLQNIERHFSRGPEWEKWAHIFILEASKNKEGSIKGKVLSISKPTIGVLITYYNEKEMLMECLDSVFSQTKKPDEVMVYDDFSKFPAEDYIPKQYNQQVCVIRASENKGPGYGRNHLLKKSRCEYVHFHDVDDSFCPLWCERVSDAAESTGADIVLTEVSKYINDQLVSERNAELHYLADGWDPVLFATTKCILTIGSLLRRETALKVGGFRIMDILPQSEDYDFHIRILASGAKYTEILQPLVIKRVFSGSHSDKDMIVAWDSAAKSISMLSKELPQKYHGYLSEAAARIGSNLYSLGAHDDARKAFDLAYSIGLPRFLYHSHLYSIVAKKFGPLTAEKTGAIYRKIAPKFFRRRFNIEDDQKVF